MRINAIRTRINRLNRNAATKWNNRTKWRQCDRRVCQLWQAWYDGLGAE